MSSSPTPLDLITRAKQHEWWYSDKNLALELIDAYSDLTTQIAEFQTARDVSLKSHLDHLAEVQRLTTLVEELQLVQAAIPEIVIEERDEARAEVERLRDLLRACLPHFERGQSYLWQRVRKALNEPD